MVCRYGSAREQPRNVYARTICARATAIATQAPAGPVHLNFPFREPLIPKMDENLFTLSERTEGYVKVHNGDLVVQDQVFIDIAEKLNGIKKGMIVCGNLADEKFAQAVTALAAKLNYPILADPLSQLRSGTHEMDHIVETYDSFLRNQEAKSF